MFELSLLNMTCTGDLFKRKQLFLITNVIVVAYIKTHRS